MSYPTLRIYRGLHVYVRGQRKEGEGVVDRTWIGCGNGWGAGSRVRMATVRWHHGRTSEVRSTLCTPAYRPKERVR